ncbi:PQQ-binding-like beta-propeller repeat protein [Cellulomonas sp. JZ18]|uniref:outer membrane protein assembly factor BamB family protein n=1 Tax=Cellulomonas sp. JZ18 TaxID=2654191 RepID=UPI0018AFB689|nr:PQQ-binding-like beta-propeller repeat protein [Cellulomonas sp. JZ18]
MALRDVELVEEVPPEPGPTGRDDVRPPWRRHPRRTAAVAAVLVVAVAAAVGLELRTRADDAARVSALRAVPGVLGPVDPALPVARRLTADDAAGQVLAMALLHGVRAGGVTVTGGQDGSRGVVVGVDLGTGAEVWRTALPARGHEGDVELAHVWCTASQEDVTASRQGRRHPVEDGLVGCVSTWRPRVDDAAVLDGTTDVPTLFAVDPVDGRARQVAELPAGASTTRVDDGWVVVSAADGPVVVEHRGDDGASRWRTVLEGARSAPPPWSGPVVGRGAVLVTTPDDGAWLLGLSDGSVARRLPDARGTGGLVLPGGDVVVAERGQGEGPGVLHRADGTSDDLDGEVLVPVEVDDGSLGDVLLTSRGSLSVTLRRPDGAVVWRADAPLTQAMVVDGTVVGVTAGEVVRLDGDDGATRWRARRPLVDPYPYLLTDGAVVMLATTGGVDAWTFDGEPAWAGRPDRTSAEPRLRAVAPDPSPPPVGEEAPLDVFWAVTPDGRLLAQVAEQLLVLG